MVNHIPDAPVLDVLADPTRRAVVAMLAEGPHPARVRGEPLDDVAHWAARLQSFWAHKLAAFAGFVRTKAGERSKARRRPRGRIPGRRSKRDGRRHHGRASQR